MSARTRKNSASPPTISNVSGEVAWSREMVGAAATATLTLGAGLSFTLGLGFGLGLADCGL